MQLIVVENQNAFKARELVEAMFGLRARVFCERLRWQVAVDHGLERDRFDALGPTYLLLVEREDRVVGCVRLLEPRRGSMLQEVFPALLAGPLVCHSRMIESSRFCIERSALGTASSDGRGPPDGMLANVWTRMLLAGIVEWCLLQGYDEVVTATDLRFERLLRMVGWPLQRLGEGRLIDETPSVAGALPISDPVFQRLRPRGYPGLFLMDDETRSAMP